jgi:hypothetical protein
MYHLVVFKEGKLGIQRITKIESKSEAIEKYYKFKDSTYCELWYSRYNHLSHKEIKKIANLEKLSIVETEYSMIVQLKNYDRILPLSIIDHNK